MAAILFQDDQPIVAGCLILATVLPTSDPPDNHWLRLRVGRRRFDGETGAALHQNRRMNRAGLWQKEGHPDGWPHMLYIYGASDPRARLRSLIFECVDRCSFFQRKANVVQTVN